MQNWEFHSEAGRNTMQSQAPTTTTTTRPAGQLTHKILSFIMFLVWGSITPILFAQQDVHAALIPPAGRKSAPAFQLVTEDGSKMQISAYRGKVVLLNFW